MKARIRSLLCFLIVLATTGSRAPGQVHEAFQVPEQTQEVDLSAKNGDRRVVFLADGQAMEASLRFSMIRHRKIEIEAELPEPGRFDVQLAGGSALVEIKNVRTQGKKGRAEVVPRVELLSPRKAAERALAEIEKLASKDARKKPRQEADKRKTDDLRSYLLRQGIPLNLQPDDEDKLKDQYVLVRSLDESPHVIRDKIEEIAQRRPRWFLPEDKQRWSTAPVGALVLGYQELLEMELADEHFQSRGFSYDSSTRNAARNLRPMLRGAEFVLSGDLADNPEGGKFLSDVFSSGDLDRLRQSVLVDLRCRLYPTTDAQDANALWFNGQRVTCRAAGVSVIRVEGTLDPSNHDRVDWWILDRYESGSVVLETSQDAGVRVDPAIVDPSGARLCVVATGKAAVKYWIEFRPREKSDGLQVIVHESPADAEAKFPF